MQKGQEMAASRVRELRSQSWRRAPAALAAVVTLALLSVGCGSGDDSRDEALAALELTSEAASLQSEMSELVSELSANPSAAQRREFERSLDALDRRAAQLIAEADVDSTVAGDETPAAEQTAMTEAVAALDEVRAAGDSAVAVVARPISDRARVALDEFEERLDAATQHLGGSVELAERALDGDSGDGLSEEDRAQLADARAASESARRASRQASAKLQAVIDAAVAEREQLITEREAAEAEAAAEAAVGCETEVPNYGQASVDIQGDASCEEAQSVFQTYYSDATPKMGSGGSAEVDGWFCISNSAGAIGRGESSLTTCEKDGEEIRTVVP